MSNGLNACENDQQIITEHSQRDASCAGQLASAQCDQNKDDQSSSQHPWRWTTQTVDQIEYGTTKLTKNFCKRCQNIFDILTRVLLCWDEVPPMWAAASSAPGGLWGSPSLRSFYVSFGCICLTKTTDCGICTLFTQMIRSTLQGEGIHQREEVAVLLNMDNIGKVEPKPDADDAHKGASRWMKAMNFGIYDVKLAAVLPLPGTAFLHDELGIISPDEYFLVSVGPIVRLIDTDDVATQHINSHRTDRTESHISIGLPRLRPAFAEPSKFVTWLDGCEQLHDRRCRQKSRNRNFTHKIRLLNTESLRIESFDPDLVPRYFALSYVWGTKKYLRLEGKGEGANVDEASTKGFSLSANFHPSISDTIALMNGMKEKYLWVDSLCIVQDSDSDKHAQIEQMGAVYANSYLTIVAAGNDQSGLAGISQPRAGLDSIRVGSLILVADPCSCRESDWFDYVAWSTRAWTLQEHILSHRKLIFTADQVYWWCPCASWRESVHLASLTHRYQEFETKLNPTLADIRKQSITGLATKSRRDYEHLFGGIIEEYSGRQLTKQADRLSAISGILNAIHRLNPRRSYFWALTMCSFEIELDWYDLIPSESRGEFVPIADSMFPSWSWLSFPGPVGSVSGHRSVVCFRLFYESSSARLECRRISDLKLVFAPGTRSSSHIPVEVSVKHIQSNFASIALKPDQQIIFWVDVVKLGVHWNRNLDHATGRLLTGFDERLLVTEIGEDQRCCLWAWSAEIDKTQTEYDFISINADFKAVSQCRSIWILTWRNGVAIRAGHGVILQKVWDSLAKVRRIILME